MTDGGRLDAVVVTAEPEVAVVIPALQAAATLPRQLAALHRACGDHPFRVVVADNGSTDGTKGVAAAFSGVLDVTVVDAGDRPGAAHARNVGAAAVPDASMLVFVDADDEVQPGFVDAMVAGLGRSPVACGRLDHERLNAEHVRASRSSGQTDGVPQTSFLPFASSAAFGVRADVFGLLGGFDERLLIGQDTDLSWRAQLAGFEIEFVPDAIVAYRQPTSSAGGFRQARRWAEADAALRARYAPLGAPATEARESLRRWRRTAGHVVAAARGRGDRHRAAFLAGDCVGRLVGSVRHRTWYV